MTGRRLYDQFTDALKETQSHGSSALPGQYNETLAPAAWPYLSGRDKRTWNVLARKITPAPKRRQA